MSAQPELRPAVFLDKDGTLIEDLPYNVDPRRIRLAPGAAEGVRLLHDAGYALVVVTNQSGVARGWFTLDELDRVADHLRAVLAGLGAPLTGFYACPHGPEGDDDGPPSCDCRKPLPGLIRRAANELNLDLGGSWLVGDTWMDVLAGREAGCRTVLVGPEWRLVAGWPAERRPEHAVFDLGSAAQFILARDVEVATAESGTRHAEREPALAGEMR
jgi:D-glycero-D-manno-heptose 1,7-bisphosphate phosphatase